MANDMNVVTMIGRFVRDPELTYTQGGASKCTFSLAVGYGYTQNGERKERPSFFNWLAWGKVGEAIAHYCKQGHRIGVMGRAQQRSWEDKEGKKHYVVEFVIERVQFLQTKVKDETKPEEPQGDPPPFFEDVPPGEVPPFDDIPF